MPLGSDEWKRVAQKSLPGRPGEETRLALCSHAFMHTSFLCTYYAPSAFLGAWDASLNKKREREKKSSSRELNTVVGQGSERQLVNPKHPSNKLHTCSKAKVPFGPEMAPLAAPV